MDNDKLAHIRHTLAHLTAAAVRELWPGSQNAIGPAIDDGFYQDFEIAGTVTDADLPKIEKKIRQMIPTWTHFEKIEVTKEEALKEFAWNTYKTELIEEFAQEGKKLTFHNSPGLVDLCKGGHLENPAKELPLDCFKLDRIAGAYWRGDEKNKMLTRIYGLAFESKEKLDEHLVQREEAKKRDHKVLGQKLELFTFSELVGRGLPMFLPKGAWIRDMLYEYIRSLKLARGYSFVAIPHIAKKALYEKSGHMGKYDAMMPTMTDQNGDEFVMKAMNCPHHFELYNAQQHSYRDLPLRFAENTTCYRNEKSGELAGLLRVKSLTQDDTHHFVTEEQIEEEIQMIIGLMQEVYTTFGFNDFKVEISIRDKKNPEKYFGGDELWSKAENKLIDIVKKWGAEYSIEEGEAAFYGPKIDVKVKDSIGRTWQLTTVQLDFNQPQNFDLHYTDKDGSRKHVVVIHAAIFGSIERFMGVLIEHTAGNFQTWLSPVQVAIVPVRENHNEFAQKIQSELKAQIIRTEMFDADISLGKRIHAGKATRAPYVIVIGDKEMESGNLTIEKRDGTKEEISLDELSTKLKEEIQNRS